MKGSGLYLVLLIIMMSSLISCSKPEKGEILNNKQHVDRSNWNRLDWLNFDDSLIFEKDIKYDGFIVLADDFDPNQPIKLFNNKMKSIEINASMNDVITKIGDNLYDRYNDENPLNPWLFSKNPDYFRIAFECVSKEPNFYKVMLNDHDFGFVPVSKEFEYQTSEDFVFNWIRSHGLDFNRLENPIKTEPLDQGEIIHHELVKKYSAWRGEEVFEMKGDWIKLKTEVTNEVGWIRWRNGEKILVRMYFAY